MIHLPAIGNRRLYVVLRLIDNGRIGSGQQFSLQVFLAVLLLQVLNQRMPFLPGGRIAYISQYLRWGAANIGGLRNPDPRRNEQGNGC